MLTFKCRCGQGHGTVEMTAVSTYYLNKKKSVAPDLLILMIVLGLFVHFMENHNNHNDHDNHDRELKSKSYIGQLISMQTTLMACTL